MIKVLVVASIGGHWIQLLRLRPSFEVDGLIEPVYISTRNSFASMVPGRGFYSITEASRWNKFKLLVCFFEIIRIIKKEKPAVIITTGAAPGLVAIIAGKVLGVKAIWIDSVANVQELSMSGKFALRIADKVYTQWEHLSVKNKIWYAGNIMS